MLGCPKPSKIKRVDFISFDGYEFYAELTGEVQPNFQFDIIMLDGG